jgi:hypothetical protein
VKKPRGMNIKNSKDRGAWAEMCFALRAIEEGLRPARPWGEPSGYDFLVHHKSTRIFRVQVKSTIYKMGRCYHCTIRTRNRPYKKDAFDFVAAYVIPEDVWYILPEKVVRGMSTVGLYPAMAGAKYDAYKEAWHLLRGESPGLVDRIEACAEEHCAAQNETESGHRENALKPQRDCVDLQGSFDSACGFVKRIRMLCSG